MTRQLRPRKYSQAHHSLSAHSGDDVGDKSAGAEPSTSAIVDDSDNSSEFQPDNQATVTEKQDDEGDALMHEDVDEGGGGLGTAPEPPAKQAPDKSRGPTSKGKEKALVRKGNDHPGLTRTKRQMYTLPTPSVHHRHRAVPLYRHNGRVERLEKPPELFEEPHIVITNGISENKVMERVNKAWGFNLGSGPPWEMVEDRGWFKESLLFGNGDDTDAERRPRVHREIRVKSGWKILSKEEAAPYLPSDNITTEEGNLKPPLPVECYFGPYGSQTPKEVRMFDTFPMADFLPESNAHVINPGTPAWAIDWCPIHHDDRPRREFKQYLAISPFPSNSHSPEIGVKVLRPSYACIQIWSLSKGMSVRGPVNSDAGSSVTKPDIGKMRCELVLCIEGGPAHELKWCPLPSHDVDTNIKPRKLGLLAGAFEDGSLSIYAVSDPEDLGSATTSVTSPVYATLPAPVLRIELEETSCFSLDWANSETIAIGTTNGGIAVYDVVTALQRSASADSPTVTDILPTHYITVHQSAIRALAWIRAPPSSASGDPKLDEDPTVIASGGYDGMECLTDIREGHGNVMNRTRDVISTMSYSPFGSGPVTIDHENAVKAYSASPSMLGRGHTLLEPQGPVWSVTTSDWHPQLSVGSADGSCLTTNMLRSTRRSGSVPFFVHKIYQMDFSRKTEEYRMLDQFLPQETQDRLTASKVKANKKSSKADKPSALSTGAWPHEVAVHKVAWNNGNGLAACGLLASATSSGLCRVDNLWGRWLRDKPPYGGIGRMRMEVDEDMDVDTEESGSDEQ